MVTPFVDRIVSYFLPDMFTRRLFHWSTPNHLNPVISTSAYTCIDLIVPIQKIVVDMTVEMTSLLSGILEDVLRQQNT